MPTLPKPKLSDAAALELAEEIRQLLIGLGSTVDEVAENLMAKSAAGKVNSLRRCPVAVYLRRSGRRVEIRVFRDFVWVEDFHLRLPQPVADFIEMFDRGDFRNSIDPKMKRPKLPQ